MPPIPTIGGVFRVTLNYASNQGVAPRNVFHVGAPLLDVTEVAGVLNDNWQTQQAQIVGDDFLPTSFDILPLDGTTPTSTWPFEGPGDFCNGDNEFIPEAAAVISLKTSQRGPRGRGRVFIGPAGEANCLNGQLASDNASELQTAWSDFSAALLPDGVALVVASYVHEDFHLVENISVSTGLATQRRRLLQQRA
jgi:hypothetical protein